MNMKIRVAESQASSSREHGDDARIHSFTTRARPSVLSSRPVSSRRRRSPRAFRFRRRDARAGVPAATPGARERLDSRPRRGRRGRRGHPRARRRRPEVGFSPRWNSTSWVATRRIEDSTSCAARPSSPSGCDVARIGSDWRGKTTTTTTREFGRGRETNFERGETRDETRPRVRTTTNGRRGVSTREGGNREPSLGNLREPSLGNLREPSRNSSRNLLRNLPMTN